LMHNNIKNNLFADHYLSNIDKMHVDDFIL